MKKIYCIIVLIALIICFVGCDVSKESNSYVALLHDFSDSISSSNKKKEYNFADTEKYKDIKIQKQINAKIHDKDFAGNYMKTRFKSYNYYPEFEYEQSNGDSFCIDENGKLVCYFNSDRNLIGAILSQEECVQKAKEFLSGVVDITPYTINVNKNTEKEYYDISLVKYINGIKTTDQIRLSVNFDGTIYSYSAFMLDRIPVDTKTEDINFNKIKQIITEKVDCIYNNIKNNYDRIDYGKQNYTLTILSDGNRAIICKMEVKAVIAMGEYEMCESELLEFVVPVK
ncbi:MAG: hypothetical protein E7365_02695 [Clostridiales bacterium]|nr:hypothetical protein [Clostridiales bacterium]